MQNPVAHDSRILEGGAILGLSAGIGLLLVAFVADGMAILSVPGLMLIVPSLLYESR